MSTLERFEFREILREEAEAAVEIEQICFPPNEACSREHMLDRIEAAADLFLVAIDRRTGKMAGFLNGIATDETKFRDAFFVDAGTHRPEGSTVMLLGLDVLPKYRLQGLGRELVRNYCRREKGRGRRRLVLTCLDDKVQMYEKFGFRDLGESSSDWGGEKWHEMELPLSDRCTFRPARRSDREAILALYQAAIGTEGCTWDETYPSQDILEEDLSRKDLFCMEKDGRIVGAVSIDDDPLTDALPVWNPELHPAAEIARVVVSGNAQGRGIAPMMLSELQSVLIVRGYAAAHYLVSPDNQKALHAYEKLGYVPVGEADLYEHHWLCYEKHLR